MVKESHLIFTHTLDYYHFINEGPLVKVVQSSK